MNRKITLPVGLVIAAGGARVPVFPLGAAGGRGRAAGEATQRIKLRARFGGTLLGLGAFVAWWPAVRPWTRTILGLLMWAMAGVGLARLLGFVLDGSPDGRQWIWLVAEVLIVATCAVLLRRRSR